MITITLAKIKARRPCSDGWEKILAARGGPDADLNAEFPLVEALDSNGLGDVLWALRCLPEHEAVWQLFARQCALDVIHLWDAPDDVRTYLETGDETLRDAARDAAWATAGDAARDAARAAAEATAWAARDAAWATAWAAAWAARAARDAARDARDAARDARAAQMVRLRGLIS